MSEENQFQLNPANVLAYEFQLYISNIKALALSKPDKFFQLRAEVIQQLKIDAVSNLYKSVFELLTTGRALNKRPIGSDVRLGEGQLIPRYPSQLVNDICISMASDLGKALDNAIEIILPSDFESLSNSQLKLKGKGTGISIN
jgi:hypothetical protein